VPVRASSVLDVVLLVVDVVGGTDVVVDVLVVLLDVVVVGATVVVVVGATVVVVVGGTVVVVVATVVVVVGASDVKPAHTGVRSFSNGAPGASCGVKNAVESAGTVNELLTTNVDC
jgi:hypothetical protein